MGQSERFPSEEVSGGHFFDCLPFSEFCERFLKRLTPRVFLCYVGQVDDIRKPRKTRKPESKPEAIGDETTQHLLGMEEKTAETNTPVGDMITKKKRKESSQHPTNVSFGVVCSSNMNRSMEAHLQFEKHKLVVYSYGVGNRIRLPGT